MILSKNLIQKVDNKVDHSTSSNNTTTIDNNFIIVQKGANWIHGLNPLENPMAALAEECNFILHQTSSDDEPGEDVLLYNLCRNDSNNSNNTIDDDSISNISHTITSDDYSKSLKRYDWMKLYLDLFYEYKQIYEKESNNIVIHHNLSLYEVFEIARIASERTTNILVIDDYINSNNDNIIIKHENISNKDDHKEDYDNISNTYIRSINNLIIKSGQYIIPSFGICTKLEQRIIHWFYDRISIDLGILYAYLCTTIYNILHMYRY